MLTDTQSPTLAILTALINGSDLLSIAAALCIASLEYLTDIHPAMAAIAVKANDSKEKTNSMVFKAKHLNYGFSSLRAKGRLKKGELNRTEESYAGYLESEKQSGRVADYWFESLKLKVADGTCWYTPDFMVLLPDGRLELHEVKGSPRVFFDDAKCKVKVVATSFPFAMKVVYPRAKKNGGGWDVDEF